MTERCAMCKQTVEPPSVMQRCAFGWVCDACWKKAQPQTAAYWMEYNAAMVAKGKKKRGAKL